jgi:hypothetical protein
VGGQRRAVDGDEWSRSSAPFVNGSRHPFFAGAGFTLHDDRQITCNPARGFGRSEERRATEPTRGQLLEFARFALGYDDPDPFATAHDIAQGERSVLLFDAVDEHSISTPEIADGDDGAIRAEFRVAARDFGAGERRLTPRLAPHHMPAGEGAHRRRGKDPTDVRQPAPRTRESRAGGRICRRYGRVRAQSLLPALLWNNLK